MNVMRKAGYRIQEREKSGAEETVWIPQGHDSQHMGNTGNRIPGLSGTEALIQLCIQDMDQW